MYDKLQDVDWLKQRYVTEQKTLQQIADEVGCHKRSVWRAMKKHNIKRRKRTSKYRLLNDKNWLHQMYAVEKKSIKEIAELAGSTAGNVQAHLTVMGVNLRGPKEAHNLKYPDGRSGSKAGNWQGGRRIQDGYIFIYAPWHPYTSKGKPYIQEHRLIMEEKLGRYLEPYEVVHHKDGNRQNNHPDNLVVKTRGKHVSEHFKASHEVLQMRQRVAELEDVILLYLWGNGLEPDGFEPPKHWKDNRWINEDDTDNTKFSVVLLMREILEK